jgi:hypothetical protein
MARAPLSTSFEELLSRDLGNFEEQNRSWGLPYIIYYCIIIIIINAFIINEQYNYHIFLIKASTRNEIRKTMWQ